jgi:Helix-turn-helix of insertion element transposase
MATDDRNSNRGRKPDDLDAALEKTKASLTYDAEGPLTAAQEQAAQMVAEGRFEFRKIAESVGIDVATLFRWRRDEPFAARVAEISAEFAAAALKRGVARKDYRLSCLANVHSKLLTVIEERGEAEDMQNVPGGKSGLLVKTYKVSGEMVMTEYAVDTGLIRELRGIQEQAAKEMGQLVEKREIRLLKDMTDEELDDLYAQLSEPVKKEEN